MIYIGSYADAGKDGIHALDLDSNGKLTYLFGTSGVQNPSFLALHPNKKFLYAACESDKFNGRPSGAVAAFAIDGSGKLRLLNQQASEGGGACHISVDKEGKVALVANYGGGTVASLPIERDGSLRPAASADLHEGKSVNAGRQERPHAHSINPDPSNKFAIAADLGTDKLYIYRLDPERGTLLPNDTPFVTSKPGAGPRHVSFHPNGQFAYAINELDNTITPYRWDARSGVLTPLTSVPTLPSGFTGNNTTAEVRVHPNGNFVYGSNRGHNSIAVFACNPGSGELKPVDHTLSGGKTPRNFALDLTGKFMLVAHQDTNNITVFRVDAQTGKLTSLNQSLEIPKPVCIRFV